MAHPELALVGDIGGTNMRLGVASKDGLVEGRVVPTPSDPDEFFRTIGETITYFMTDHDIKVGAIGFPGPVKITPDGIKVGPITNIPALNEAFDINRELQPKQKS